MHQRTFTVVQDVNETFKDVRDWSTGANRSSFKLMPEIPYESVGQYIFRPSVSVLVGGRGGFLFFFFSLYGFTLNAGQKRS